LQFFSALLGYLLEPDGFILAVTAKLKRVLALSVGGGLVLGHGSMG